jgi:hypothetical protein
MIRDIKGKKVQDPDQLTATKIQFVQAFAPVSLNTILRSPYVNHKIHRNSFLR